MGRQLGLRFLPSQAAVWRRVFEKGETAKMVDHGFGRMGYIILISLVYIVYYTHRRLWRNIENKAVRSNASSASNWQRKKNESKRLPNEPPQATRQTIKMEKHESAQVATNRWSLRIITRINGTRERASRNVVPVLSKPWRKKRNSRPPPNKPNCKPLEKMPRKQMPRETHRRFSRPNPSCRRWRRNK